MDSISLFMPTPKKKNLHRHCRYFSNDSAKISLRYALLSQGTGVNNQLIFDGVFEWLSVVCRSVSLPIIHIVSKTNVIFACKIHFGSRQSEVKHNKNLKKKEKTKTQANHRQLMRGRSSIVQLCCEMVVVLQKCRDQIIEKVIIFCNRFVNNQQT